MSTSTLPRRDTPVHLLHRAGLLRDLTHPRQVVAHLGPNWFAAVMGTGIVATAAVTLPLRVPGLHLAALLVWVVAALLLVALCVATAAHRLLHRDAARGHARHPVMVHSYGAPPMALLTVGAGALLPGKDLLGEPLAVAVSATLWTLGTVAGLASAVVVPYLVITRHDTAPDAVFGGWLMPVVPPMVSAATGALLVPHAPAGQVRLTLLLACYAMFGAALLASLVVTTLIVQRLVRHGVGPAATVPALWIVLGWLGQSVTAANLLGGVAHLAVPGPYASALVALGVVYGIPVLGAALLWIVLAGALTLRTARSHLPFSLTWWSFTFPVGTVVTGTSALALHTGATALAALAVVLYAGLVSAWVVVAGRTARGSARGHLFLPPAPVRP
ncbi:TDT family transporter [Pseudonocardia sp. KRD-184]|uniref:TDT family transporter n=1 Tax=Pseudonocardia oceani TaxID=2792013 RepID=A0ABS6U4B9_9PSEU|nr:TDT family transporter [Pseudonocardia oceani]MBW0091688.1 TDT family transporter [Pseudonocardia oceani]MBW0098776.1 TDT family transporter [Pseudonocardia oceani]MBW0111332.1 TDT family transporter [Pseudonocardia oceani]MBW0124766.1 TDT family transporter [Pseudonocardia oceani]MBW0126749.1 TDT family transporter [Pseudonocardia oceani]